MIYIATAYWCHDNWVVAAGADKAAVTRDADAYVAAHPDEYDAAGNFAKPDAEGRAAEGYIIEEVEESKP
jgi:hypothetical protein